MNLKKLIITNFAIIDKLDINFQPGLSVITGETGAGKSIIIGALNLAFGEKASSSMIRTGCEEAIIECCFAGKNKINSLYKLLDENNFLNFDNQLVLKRKISANGRSKAWINNHQCSVSMLKQVGAFLVDLHGQHDHQSLLNEENHLGFLDSTGNYSTNLEEVEKLWHTLKLQKEQLNLIIQKHKMGKEKKELWHFQYKEIQDVSPVENEYDELLGEKKILENGEKIHQLSSLLNEALYDGDNTFYNNIQGVIKNLIELNRIKPIFDEYLERLEGSRFLFQELSNEVTDFANNVDFEPEQLENINQRIFTLQQLMKKYGPSLSDVLNYQKDIKAKLSTDENLESEIINLEKIIKDTEIKYSKACLKLSAKRTDQAKIMSKHIVTILERLGIKDGDFYVDIQRKKDNKGWAIIENERFDADAFGFDKIRFKICTNPGEPMRPLIDIVSGGEVSRIMLALKSILAEKDQIPVLIFDEIDTGISGPIARIVGEEIEKLSTAHQILCITHLPQIASLGNDHLCVIKETRNNFSFTKMVRLNNHERLREIAKLIGGKHITDSGLQQAKELMN